MASELRCTNLTLYGQITMVEKWSVPVGHVYFQLPGESDPDELYYGTWENVSASYAGDFFRVEGGDASVFGAGEQLDQMQGHKHNFDFKDANANEGFTESNYRPRANSAGASFGQSNAADSENPNIVADPIADGTNGTPRTGEETRAVNHTIRVWKRTA